ncbi:glutathione peroxidase [Rummeliibacillus pycnus]|uniref:glutathione peroxidase n=1 Tax=Rummeliibacillus pycnus TaxID=101070 RepID=UPI000C9A46C3|nr:glutathione peroxidase [Rummeliibacillus pycnus]
MSTIYDFTVETINGEQQSLKYYEGHPLLIVNTASKCGFTPQFKELQELYEKYKNEGFTILGFPCSQFNNQEFNTINKTISYCQKNYGVEFPMFAKIDVKGKNASPLFKFLISEKKGFLTENIKWNFTKFLVDSTGHVVARYAPQTSPLKIENDIKNLI